MMRINARGQVTIPREIRERLGLVPGTEVEFSLTDDAVVCRKAEAGKPSGRALVTHMRGRVRGGLSTDEIMALTRRG
jgi:AbrB family looped-hinge helix DNA binding protein